MGNPKQYEAPAIEQLTELPPADLSGKQAEPTLKVDGTQLGTLLKPAEKTTDVINTVQVDTVSVADMINAKGSDVSETLKQRIDRHVTYLAGQRSFPSTKAEKEEQISFIETIGNSVQLNLDQYAVVTDYLIKVIRENLEHFDHGGVFKFTKGIEREYNAKAVQEFKNYMTLLVRISREYANRRQLNRMVDINTLTKGLKQKARDNINTYFRRLASGN